MACCRSIYGRSAETSEAGEEALAINEENFPDEGLRKQVKLAADNVESTTTHVGYESGISNLDIFKVKLNDNPGMEVKKSIGVSSFEIEQVTYQKEDASEKEVLTDNGGFMVRMSDFALRLTESDPEISLGGLSCDKKPDCGTYTIDLKLNVWKLDGTGGQDIPMQRTIVWTGRIFNNYILRMP